MDVGLLPMLRASLIEGTLQQVQKEKLRNTKKSDAHTSPAYTGGTESDELTKWQGIRWIN